MQEFEVLEYSQLSLLNADFSEHVSKETVPALWGASMENVTGNYIFESKDVSEGFDIKGAESIYYCKGFFYGKNCWDSDFTYYNDECHELISSTHSSLLRFCFAIFNNCHDLEYSMYCANNSHHLFGCLGLRQNQYCILKIGRAHV